MIKNLKSLRKEKGISQQQLADIILVSQQSINKYENHDVEPDIKTLTKIAEYFNVSLDYLTGRTTIKEMADAPRKSDLTENELHLIKSVKKLNKNQIACIINLIENI